MDGCQVAASYGVNDIVITDTNGSFEEHQKVGYGSCGSILLNAVGEKVSRISFLLSTL